VSDLDGDDRAGYGPGGRTGARPPWYELAAAVPLAATEQLGLGPFHRPGRTDPSRLTSLGPSQTSRYAAIDTAGATGRRLLSVLSWHGGSVTADELTAETRGADLEDLGETIVRLVAAGVVERDTSDGLRFAPGVAEVVAPIGLSFVDPQAITSDELGQVCRVLGLSPAPSRKADRIEAIRGVFLVPATRERVLADLSPPARSLLARIAEVAGPRVVDPVSIGLPAYGLHQVTTPRFSFNHDRPNVPDGLGPLAELTAHGIVGLAPWDDGVWIWREAWPLLDRPLFTDWPSVPVPRTVPLGADPIRLPPIVGQAERALRHWDEVRPATLKSGERRLAKSVLRSTAKAVGADESAVEVIAAAAVSMGLLLENVVGSSGRGRNRTVEGAWLADPEVRAVWEAAPAAARLLRIVAEWANPRERGSDQLVANRHLLLWELGVLADDEAWADSAEVARWMQHRYEVVAVDEAILESLRDLRSLGMVTAEGPVALTALGRLALEDPAAAVAADFGAADEAIVQADETIVCPPDLDADLVVRIEQLATLESDAGARIFRLDETLITKAVQRGRPAEEIVAFLDGLSSVPVPDTVKALVADCAQRAERVRIVAATTVVVVDDPADLVTACRMKSTKLTALTDTVAVSPLPPDKIRAILDRKGLAPVMVASRGAEITPRRSSDDAAELARAAERQRLLAERHGLEQAAVGAQLLADRATAARDPGSRFVVSGPIAVTPLLLERVRP
jgi:hypothetical protein